jgi:methylated-DNA-[protein]-cysteine S-methyltransferase
MMGETATATFQCPIGALTLSATGNLLTRIRFPPQNTEAIAASPSDSRAHPVLALALDQLEQWFAGQRTAFDLPLAPATAEGAALRAAIASVPYGETRTYGALAAQFGSAAQAVGQSCKTNPFPIIIPCHRVVSTAGPEFYSGGDGPRTKTWLLDFEHANLPPEQRTRLL